jgi:hypothetical protein
MTCIRPVMSALIGFQNLDVVRQTLAGIFVEADELDFVPQLLPEPNRGSIANAKVPCGVNWKLRQCLECANAALKLCLRKLFAVVRPLD